MSLGYTLKLSLKIYLTNIKVEKIDSSILEIFEMVLINFKVEDKLGRA